MSTISHLAEEISSGLRDVLPGINRNPLRKLSLCAAAVLEVQSCNTMDIAAVLPLETERIDMRYQWLSRFLSTDSIDNDAEFTAKVMRLPWVVISPKPMVEYLPVCIGRKRRSLPR